MSKETELQPEEKSLSLIGKVSDNLNSVLKSALASYNVLALDNLIHYVHDSVSSFVKRRAGNWKRETHQAIRL